MATKQKEAEEKLRKEYEEMYGDFPKEIDGQKINPISFEKFKKYKEKGVFEELDKASANFNEAIVEG